MVLGSGLSLEKYLSYNSGEAYLVRVFNYYKEIVLYILPLNFLYVVCIIKALANGVP